MSARNHAQLREALSSTLCICLPNTHSVSNSELELEEELDDESSGGGDAGGVAVSASMLEVFLCLKISLVTAVSNVITVSY